MKYLIAVLALSALVITSNQAFGQAAIVETQKAYVYVDARSGSDSHAGTASAPMRTIRAAAAKALANNARGVGTRELINPGTYREFVNIPNKAGGATITFEAVRPGTAVLDGADVLTGWLALSATEYVHSWHDTVAGCTAQNGWKGIQPIVMRNEMVFVNGEPL